MSCSVVMNLLLFCAILRQMQKPVAEEIAVKWLQRKISWQKVVEEQLLKWTWVTLFLPCAFFYVKDLRSTWSELTDSSAIPFQCIPESEICRSFLPYYHNLYWKNTKYHVKVLLSFPVSEFAVLLIHVPVKSIKLKNTFERLFSCLAYSVKMYARQQICFLDYCCLNFK